MFHFENHLCNWSFENATAVVTSIFSKFRQNFVDSIDAKNVCSQIYYICYRVLSKKEVQTLAGDFLLRISSASDIFALENTIHELLEYTKNQFTGTSMIQNQLVETAIHYIYNNLSGYLSLESCAEHLHVSSTHLGRTFKKLSGESISEYINKVRIEKAKEYLSNTDLRVYEIAMRIGYGDATYFSSIFKKHTGISPKDYRRNFQNDV